MNEIDISCEECYLENGQKGVLIKLASPFFELNIRFLGEHFYKFSPLMNREIERLTLGETLNSDVHWIINENKLSLVIGEDIDTWDIGYVFKIEVLVEILEKTKKLL